MIPTRVCAKGWFSYKALVAYQRCVANPTINCETEHLALATDPIDPGVLTRLPRPQEAQLLDWRFGKRIALVGCPTAGVALGAFAYAWYSDGR
jgi:hypothetical protein